MPPKPLNFKAIGLRLRQQAKPTAARADHPVRHLAANEGFLRLPIEFGAAESRPAAPAFR